MNDVSAEPLLERARAAGAHFLAAVWARTRYPAENRIPTHLTPREKRLLFRLAARKRDGILVEIGSYLGASASFLAAGIRAAGGRGRLHCIDTWGNEGMSEGLRDTYAEFQENISASREWVVPLRGTSPQIAPGFPGKVDLLFIDGDHSYEGVLTDVSHWLPRMNDGAFILLHDHGWCEGVQQVVRERVRPVAKAEFLLPNTYMAAL